MHHPVKEAAAEICCSSSTCHFLLRLCLCCRASENHTTKVQELGRLCRYPSTVPDDVEKALAVSVTASDVLATHTAGALIFASQKAAPIWANVLPGAASMADAKAAVEAAAVSKFKEAEDLNAYTFWMSQNMSRQHGIYMKKLQELVGNLNEVSSGTNDFCQGRRAMSQCIVPVYWLQVMVQHHCFYTRYPHQ